MKITVVIPTIGRSSIEKTLSSIIKQPYDSLIVLKDYYGNPSKNRNKLLDLNLDTDWIAFIDDDAIANDNWLSEGRKFIESNNFQGFHGNVYGGLIADEVYNFIGTNYWIKYSIFQELEGFDEELKYFEDVELGWRLAKADYKWGYAKNCKVNHPCKSQSKSEKVFDFYRRILLAKHPDEAMRLFKENISYEH